MYTHALSTQRVYKCEIETFSTSPTSFLSFTLPIIYLPTPFSPSFFTSDRLNRAMLDKTCKSSNYTLLSARAPSSQCDEHF